MKSKDQLNEWELQNRQYNFPYHHTPYFQGGTPRIVRSLSWGLEYLCYLHHARQLIEDLKPASILDVGCGDGRLLHELSTVSRRVGADLSLEAIAFARAFSPDVEFHVKSANDLKETFDVVSVIEVLEHIPDDAIPAFISSLEERVSPGGHLVISVPTIVRPCNPKHHRHYSSETLRSQIQAQIGDWPIIIEDHVFADTLITKLYQKLTVNRYWTADIPLFSRAIWNQVWNKRIKKTGDGVHLMLVLKRPV